MIVLRSFIPSLALNTDCTCMQKKKKILLKHDHKIQTTICRQRDKISDPLPPGYHKTIKTTFYSVYSKICLYLVFIKNK